MKTTLLYEFTCDDCWLNRRARLCPRGWVEIGSLGAVHYCTQCKAEPENKDRIERAKAVQEGA
jgi:hypothetical protein